jgi:DNA-binding transcriptional ArsR family regulator
MKIDVIYEKGIICEFVYWPLNEMFCALHILMKPEHHLHRNKWIKKVSNDQKILNEIKKYGNVTEEYCIVMDFCSYFEECTDLNVLSSIEFLSNIPLNKINKIFKNYDKKITQSQYNGLLELLKKFYINIFADELKYIEPMMTRILKKKAKIAEEIGIFNFVDKIHERIKVNEEEIIFYKNKEYVVKKKEVKTIIINLSTFISPHLMLGLIGDNLYLTYLIELEVCENQSPKDLERTLKALGDGTRLKILKEISRKGKSTQELSVELKISEAAISKALKFLYEAELVEKERQGNYIIYSASTTNIDYIVYRIYEYIYN